MDQYEPLHAETDDHSALEATLKESNSRPGLRRVPAKTIPVPTHMDAATANLVAGAYLRPAFEPETFDDAGWRKIVKKLVDATLPVLAKARSELGVTIEPITIGGVSAFMLTPKHIPPAHENQLVFQIHGGGYVHCPGEAGTGEAMLMAAYGGYRVLAIDYRMPPDAPYPAAMDDVTAAWRALVRTADPRRIGVEGTSTGGGMTLALMLRLKAEGLPLPGAIAPGSPWSDMTETGDSYKINEWVDNVVVSYSGYLSQAARLYAAGHDLKDPQLSPIYGDFDGLPPAILTSGTRDLFLSNTVRAHRKLRAAGVDADLHVHEGLSHSQYLFDPGTPVTKEVFREITRFFDTHLAN